MKTIFQKEWRENFKLAVIAFIIFGLALAQAYRSCSNYYTMLLSIGEIFGRRKELNPAG